MNSDMCAAQAAPSTLADRISYLADRILDEVSALEATTDRVFGDGDTKPANPPTTGVAATSLPLTADRLSYQVERLTKLNARLRELA